MKLHFSSALVARQSLSRVSLPQRVTLVTPRSRRRIVERPSAAEKTEEVKEAKPRKSRRKQIGATDMLMKLLQAPDAQALAADRVDSLTEEFFTVASTYLEMARKENNPTVLEKLEAVLRIAMDEKKKTLRPEIQLFNRLLAATTQLERQQVLNTQRAGETLLMNNRFFFTMLDRMTADVARQPDSVPRKASLLQQLQAIKADATARIPPAV